MREVMKTLIIWNLQLLADAGTLTNYMGTVAGDLTNGSGYVNSYTGVNAVTNAMDPELKTFYDTELLENARIDMVYAQFAKKQNLPRGRGKTVEWRKWNTFDKASALTEGVIPTGQQFGITAISETIGQYGTYASITDQLELHAYDDVILGATEEMGASMAETQEYLIRAKLETVTNVLYADNLDAAGAYLSTPSGVATTYNDSTYGYAYLTPDMISKAVTKMKKAKVPTINGKYYCVVHPDVAEDLRRSDDWVEAHKYARPEEIYNGEIGELHGVRFLESNYAPIIFDASDATKHGGSYASGTNNAAIYYSFLFGKDGFGIVDPEGGAAQMIVHDKSEIGGPLNQFSTIGYKLETATAILYTERVLNIISCSSYSVSATAN